MEPTPTCTGTPAAALVFAPTQQGYQYASIPASLAGRAEVTVALWGAGGGGAAGVLAVGGSGAFVSGALPVTPGETLRLVVGVGGSWSRDPADPRLHQPDWAGGGGYGAPPLERITQPHYYGGGGGGRSAIQRLNGSGVWVDVVVAGGGGGGGGWDAPGGAGGVAQGRRGGDQAQSSAFAINPDPFVTSVSAFGGGGSQSGGGAGRVVGATGWACNGGDGTNGTRNQCGGGGGGYYGGGAGDDAPGGGGSSLITALRGAVGADGAGALPFRPPPESPWAALYADGVGVGGATMSPGGPGRVVVVLPVGVAPVTPSFAPTPSRSGSSTPTRSAARSASPAAGSRTATATRSRTRSASATRSRSRSPTRSGSRTRSRSASRKRKLLA